MPEHPEVCFVIDSLGMVESTFEYVQEHPSLFHWHGIVEINGNLAHIYRFRNC